MLKLLQTTTNELRQILVFIWTKILALDKVISSFAFHELTMVVFHAFACCFTNLGQFLWWLSSCASIESDFNGTLMFSISLF